MKRLADHVQAVALGALGSDPADRLAGLRPALRDLRAAYQAGEAPDFSARETRAAYTFAYHPHHCVLAAEAFGGIGSALLGVEGKDVVRVVILGAGPAPELVALAWMLRDSGQRIEAHLVDREQGWTATRRTTLDATVGPWPIDITFINHVADLQQPSDLDSVWPLVRDADLVIAQAVLTELAAPAEEGQLLDLLTQQFGARTRLVVIDFDRIPRTQAATQRLDASRNLVTLTTAQFVLPASRPIEPLATHLYDTTDGLLPRHKLRCALRVVGRPGTVSTIASDIEPTADQAAALVAFRRFLASEDRVFVLRGAAGTGKTTLFPSIERAAATKDLPVVLLAPTGRAARRLRNVVGRAGSTLHSHLYRYAETEDRTDDEPPLARFVLRDPPTEPAVYIVDEASLIGNKLETAEQEATAEVLFGDGRLLTDLLSSCLHAPASRVVFVGDPNQLPPVGEDVSQALDLDRLQSLVGFRPHSAELTEVVRQGEGSRILDLAHAWFAEGTTPTTCHHEPEAGIDLLQSTQIDPWLVTEVQELRAAIVAARNADVRTWNMRVRDAAKLRGRPPQRGERLLVIRTDLRTGLFNGDEVEVVEADHEAEVIRIRDDKVLLRRAQLAVTTAAGQIVIETLLVDGLLAGGSAADQRMVNRVLHANFVMRTGLRPSDAGFQEAHSQDERVHALRATYAYARTGHRAQGGEWDHVVVDFAGSRAFGPHAGRWAYTALTRARRVVHLANAGKARYTSEGLLDGAAGCLSEAGLTIAGHRSIQHGLQLTVERAGATVDVNVFLKDGLPSSCTPSGRDADGLHGAARETLIAWIEQQRSAELPLLPPRLEQHAARVAALLSEQGYDLRAYPRAQYQATFEAKAPGRAAALTFHHKASGELGSELLQVSSGDVTVLATLRTAIEATRG